MPDDTTTAEETEDTTQQTDTDTADQTSKTDTDDKDWKAEAEKFKALSRKNEQRAKENAQKAKDYDALKEAQMTEQEKAVNEASKKAAADAEAAALTKFGARLVDAEVKAACAGRDIDVATLLEGLDRSRFLTDDGEADAEAITAWVDKLAPAAKKKPGVPGQGSQGETIDADEGFAAFSRSMKLPDTK